jgi:hypothetical protein
MLLLTAKKDEAIEAAEKIQSLAEKIMKFLVKQGGLFADAFSKKLGELTAIGVAGLGIWTILGEKLEAVFRAAKAILGF